MSTKGYRNRAKSGSLAATARLRQAAARARRERLRPPRPPRGRPASGVTAPSRSPEPAAGDRVHRIGPWIVRAGREFTVVSANRETVASFDLEGRPISWYERGRVFKRSLASAVFGREREHGARRHWRVDDEEAAAMFATLVERVAAVPVATLPAAVVERLATIRRWTPERLLAERRAFESAYEFPVAILPPDQYLAVVLQATRGCSWNRCTFCGFYQDRSFAVRPLEEFRAHARAVAVLLGRAVGLRRRVFLADGNALVLANARLRPIFDTAREVFPERPLYGFVDVFGGEHKPVDDWRALAGWGLRRVYVGLETGHDPLLRWMNKPGSARDAREFVAALKEAGLSVSVILMVGAGGERFAEAHVEDSLRLLGALPLGAGDIVYLSPFHEEPASTYAERAEREGVRVLDPACRAAQYARLAAGARARLPAARVTRYDLREFVY